jgi:hypothetical protein
MNQLPQPSGYLFSVSVNNPVPAPNPIAARLPVDAETGATIHLRLSDSRSDGIPLARVFSPRTAQRWSWQAPVPFWIHGGSDGRLLSSVRPVAPDVHDVYTADGPPLARITRRAGRLLPWPRSVRRTAEFSDAARPCVGKVGT